jgi:hypothetical protein
MMMLTLPTMALPHLIMTMIVPTILCLPLPVSRERRRKSILTALAQEVFPGLKPNRNAQP